MGFGLLDGVNVAGRIATKKNGSIMKASSIRLCNGAPRLTLPLDNYTGNLSNSLFFRISMITAFLLCVCRPISDGLGEFHPGKKRYQDLPE